ncbi:MAG: YraN family protein [Acidimicrobiia bacterium]|nr:YraN family protein [Acidimicrobiia bacterium]
MSWALLKRLYSRLGSPLDRSSRSALEGQKRAPNKQKGTDGELCAYHYLRHHGYKIVARNYRKRFGEVDLIGWDGDTLAFIEVKTRTDHSRGRPEDAVHRSKQKQICRVAREYRIRNRLQETNFRFDVVSVEVNGPQERVELLKGAFGDQRW